MKTLLLGVASLIVIPSVLPSVEISASTTVKQLEALKTTIDSRSEDFLEPRLR